MRPHPLNLFVPQPNRPARVGDDNQNRKVPPMRSLLVYADGGPANEVRLQTALDIARLTGGHITLHVNTPVQQYTAMDPFGGVYLLTDALAEAERDETALIAALTAKLGAEDVPWDTRTSTRFAADGLVQAALLSDLIILSLNQIDGETDPFAVRLVGDVVLAARRPVLAVPAAATPLFISGTAMVAWSGGHEAADALRAAIPLLAHAKAVKLVTVVDDPTFFPPTEAASYLSRHGIHAEVIERPRDGQNVGTALASAAAALEADWIVMGAYGHSRFRESVFGGVTQQFLEVANFPMLLSH
jgi:nucleotide-binding universal stress UspA family protein